MQIGSVSLPSNFHLSRLAGTIRGRPNTSSIPYTSPSLKYGGHDLPSLRYTGFMQDPTAYTTLESLKTLFRDPTMKSPLYTDIDGEFWFIPRTFSYEKVGGYKNLFRFDLEMLWDSVIGPPIKHGLVSEWRLDEGSGTQLKDYNRDNHGTASVSTGWVHSPLIYEHALEFNGSSEYATCGNPTDLQITGDLTILLSAHPDGADGAHKFFLSKYHMGEYEIGSNLGYLIWRHGNGVSYESDQWYNYFTSNDIWYRVGLVRSSSEKKYYAYRNGIAYGSPTSFSNDPLVSANVVTIGRRSGDVYWYDGFLSEILIYNRALSAEEIYADSRRYRHVL